MYTATERRCSAYIISSNGKKQGEFWQNTGATTRSKWSKVAQTAPLGTAQTLSSLSIRRRIFMLHIRRIMTRLYSPIAVTRRVELVGQ